MVLWFVFVDVTRGRGMLAPSDLSGGSECSDIRVSPSQYVRENPETIQ